jgi:hypothetical protein
MIFILSESRVISAFFINNVITSKGHRRYMNDAYDGTLLKGYMVADANPYGEKREVAKNYRPA